ncbi:MAG: hypothetical protein H0V54_16405 [Chthoniobacterales bacterium]|nr:hypothetical protein [Chthoniobacterales bacterium]
MAQWWFGHSAIPLVVGDLLGQMLQRVRIGEQLRLRAELPVQFALRGREMRRWLRLIDAKRPQRFAHAGFTRSARLDHGTFELAAKWGGKRSHRKK